MQEIYILMRMLYDTKTGKSDICGMKFFSTKSDADKICLFKNDLLKQEGTLFNEDRFDIPFMEMYYVAQGELIEHEDQKD